MISRRRFAVIAIAGIAITIPVSRTAAATSTSEPPGSPPANALSGDINVFAAASLTNAFEAIAVEFEAANPDADLVFNFAASSELAASIVEDGTPADVFASADQNNMNKLVDAGLDDGDPATFATNSLAIVVEPGNPQGIGGVEDLADPDLIVVATSPEVPIGAYTQQVFEAAGVEVTPDSFEENVRGILTKVTEGEADAGVVYVSDVFAAGEDAEGVDIPAEINVVAEYPISAVSEAANPDGAAAFIGYVLSDEGQAILADFAFGPADAASASAATTEAPTMTDAPASTAA